MNSVEVKNYGVDILNEESKCNVWTVDWSQHLSANKTIEIEILYDQFMDLLIFIFFISFLEFIYNGIWYLLAKT